MVRNRQTLSRRYLQVRENISMRQKWEIFIKENTFHSILLVWQWWIVGNHSFSCSRVKSECDPITKMNVDARHEQPKPNLPLNHHPNLHDHLQTSLQGLFLLQPNSQNLQMEQKCVGGVSLRDGLDSSGLRWVRRTPAHLLWSGDWSKSSTQTSSDLQRCCLTGLPFPGPAGFGSLAGSTGREGECPDGVCLVYHSLSWVFFCVCFFQTRRYFINTLHTHQNVHLVLLLNLTKLIIHKKAVK